MTEQNPTTVELEALSGTADAGTGIVYVPDGLRPYASAFYRMMYRLLNTCRRAGDLRVYKDGALTFGVKPGRWMNGDTQIDYAGASEQALTDDATNYIYLTADGTLTVATDAFPLPSVTPHIRLATIETADGTYDFADIDDHRGTAMISVATATGAPQ